MTFAICQKCGAEKFGAVAQCSTCGYCPMNGSDRDIALSMIYSDHYFDCESLKALGSDIAAGVDIQIDQEIVDAHTRILSEYLNSLRQRMNPPKKWWQFWKG